MFKEKMVTPAIPERVYALCKIVEKGPISTKDLKERMEPSFLNNSTSYFNDYRTTAEELKLITISDSMVSLAVEPKIIKTVDSMRVYVNNTLESFQGGQFYQVTRAYFDMENRVLSGNKNIALWNDVFRNQFGIAVDAMALRAWRFWVTFLGFGYLQDMFFIPNADSFIYDIIMQSGLEKQRKYTITEFVNAICPQANIILSNTQSEKRFNFGVSNGLRTLHDKGTLILEHVLDFEDLWSLYPLKAHSIDTTITHITIC